MSNNQNSKNQTINKYTFRDNRKVFLDGMKDGIPIATGYFAVSFSLGIAAKNAGFNALQGFICSFFCMASAGEYAGFSLFAAASPYIAIAIMTLVVNARYLLMSTALTQRVDPAMANYHRFIMPWGITDEIFGINIAREGYLNPWYTYGALAVTVPGWSFGTYFGVVAGNLMPDRAVSALSVALFGMFLAIIIPVGKKNKIVGGIILVCFLLSYLANRLPVFAEVSSGTKTIVLTVVISAVAAAIFPHREEDSDEA